MMCQTTGRDPGLHSTPRPWRAIAFGLVTAVGATLVAACGSTSTTSVGPTPQKCELTLQAGADAVSGSGGTRTVTIGAPPECTWRASAQVAWITGVTPASGQGNGQLTFSVAANSGVARTGAVLIGEQSINVSQDAVCAFTVNPTAHSNLAASASSRTSTVATGAGCTWGSSTTTPWITVTAGSGTGSGNASFNVAANTGLARNGTVTIAGRAVTVSQVSCTYAISPANRAFGIAGGSQAITVTAPGCQWTATVQAGASWISIAPNTGSGTGNGTVTYTVTPTTGRRTATITIGTQTHTVTQN